MRRVEKIIKEKRGTRREEKGRKIEGKRKERKCKVK